MSTEQSKVLLKPFIEQAPAPLFCSGFFQSPPENFHHSESVEIDIQRDGASIAIPLPTIEGGARDNENSQYSNKEMVPPAYNERLTISSMRLLKRAPGESPFGDADVQARTLLLVAGGTVKLARKLQRTIELQASQILQTGLLTLIDQNGVALFTMNFSAKGTHFVTPTAWATGGGTGDPVANIDALADVVRTDGKTNPDTLIFGGGAWLRFLDNPRVQKFLIRDGFGLGKLAPQSRGNGASFQGFINVGSYVFECWTYKGAYEHPQTGASTYYVGDNKVVMLSSGARMDATFGSIPRFNNATNQSLLQYIPQRISSEKLSMDLSTIAYFSSNGQQLIVEVGTRPLLFPTQVDSFGCLTVF